MREVKAPEHYIAALSEHVVFLAGSIEMGAATDWQEQVKQAVLDKPGVLLNPRRSTWDPSWEQSLNNPNFFEQVSWELDGLEAADTIFMYFDPGTKSPVTMFEFGKHYQDHWLGEDMIVVCPHGFWRRGNIEVACFRAGLTLYETLEEGIAVLRSRL